MSERLKACERWHPAEPSELHTLMVKNGIGIVSPTRRCRVCRRCEHHFRTAGLPMPPRLHREYGSTKPPENYGVLPRLTWPAPEFALGLNS